MKYYYPYGIFYNNFKIFLDLIAFYLIFYSMIQVFKNLIVLIVH